MYHGYSPRRTNTSVSTKPSALARTGRITMSYTDKRHSSSVQMITVRCLTCGSSFGQRGRVVQVKKTIVYSISRPLVAPSDPISVAFPSLNPSTFLAAIFTANLTDLVKAAHRTASSSHTTTHLSSSVPLSQCTSSRRRPGPTCAM